MAGRADIDIEVLATGATARASFSVLPGDAATLGVSPRDSAIAVGSSSPLQAAVLDRHANRRAEATSLRSLDPSLTLSASGVASASDPIRAAVEVTSGTMKPETAWVSVVPAGTFAARRGNTLTLQHIDGSDFRVVVASFPFDLAWSPLDSTVLTQFAFSLEAPEGQYRVWPDGRRQRISRPGTSSTSGSILNFMFHSYSAFRDGGMAASVSECARTRVIYRIPPGGAPPIRLAPQVPDASVCVWHLDGWPSASPDGARLAFENDGVGADDDVPRLWTMDATTGDPTSLNVAGERPSWSSTDDRIAYTANERIWVINADGSGARAISPPGLRYLPGVSWSPDGVWLLVFEILPTGQSRIAVLDAATGLALPLQYTLGDGYGTGYDRPVWTTLP